MNHADKQFVAASHFHYLMWMVPKTMLLLIKITKILNDKGIFVIFESSSQATWSRICRNIRGGFIQIPEEIMTNPHLEDFRQDFGLANPELSKNPTLMEVMGDYKLYLTTYRYSLGEEGTIAMKSRRPTHMNYVETKFYDQFYNYLDHQVDNIDLIVLQNDHREPMLEVLVPIEGNTIQADIQCHIGQIVPNWNENRTRYTPEGHLHFHRVDGNLDRSQRVRSRAGQPKVQLGISLKLNNLVANLTTVNK